MDEQEVKQQQLSQNINQQESSPVVRTEEGIQKPNDTGLPKTMKTFVEAASGFFLDDVRVHYNSPKPADKNVAIYSEGTTIYVAPKAEDQLEREVWVVVRRLRQQENDKKLQDKTTIEPSILAAPPITSTEESKKEETLKETVDPHEKTTEEKSYSQQPIVNEGIKKACKAFEKAIEKAKTEKKLRQVITKTGEDLWARATKTVQTSQGEKQKGDNWNDADIYRARLRLRVLLKNSKNILLQGAKNALLTDLVYNLEQSSRGMTTAKFSDKAEKKILISGFDPFQGMDSNPSGLVAMYFDGKNIGNANIQAAVFPVRYEDFDNNIVENFFGTPLSEVDAILTVSYTHESPNIDIDRFSANNRLGGATDNDGKTVTAGPILKDGDNFYESSLPHKEIMADNDQRKTDRQYYYPQQTERQKDDGTILAKGSKKDKDQLSTQKQGPTLEELHKEGKPVNGPGGSYLSNEIHYRVSKMRTENKATKEMPQGHLHIQEPSQHATFMKDMETLIQRVLTTLKKPKK